MIVLIRHGEIEGPKGRAVGQIDLPLSPHGHKQATQLAESLESFQPRRIYCSPLTRTVQTVSLIEKKCGIRSIHIPEIKEINLGEWDGQEFAELKSRHPAEFEKRGADIAGYRPPNGENFTDLKERVSSFLKQMDDEFPAVIVTHAGVIRIILHIALGFPLDNIFRIRPDYCHATVLIKKKNNLNLQAFNLPPSSELGIQLTEMMPKQG